MYVPPHFIEHDPDYITNFIKRHSFATLISVDHDRPIATHLLFDLQDKGASGIVFVRPYCQVQSTMENLWVGQGGVGNLQRATCLRFGGMVFNQIRSHLELYQRACVWNTEDHRGTFRNS